jgi:hypothetical protein
MDATHVESGEFAMMKIVCRSVHPFEDCVPIRRVLQNPHDSDTQITVIPLLQRYDESRSDTIGEAIVFFRQILDVIRFINRRLYICSPTGIEIYAQTQYCTPVSSSEHLLVRCNHTQISDCMGLNVVMP